MKTPLDSPALKVRSKKYPARFGDRVPSKIRMLDTVYPDAICGLSIEQMGSRRDTVLQFGMEYPCWVNSYGAVSGVCANGEMLGVKPDEFEVVEFHP